MIKPTPEIAQLQGAPGNSWYIYLNELYLHSDGIWRETTSVNNQFTGYFPDKESAQKAFDKSLEFSPLDII